MATNLNTILSWFKTGLKPNQEQFWSTWQSFWHKDDAIPQSSISGLTDVLSAKAENSQFNAHKIDVNAHAALFAKAKIYLPGELQIFKKLGYNIPNALEVGDCVIAIIQGLLIKGTYIGGNPLLLASYNILDQDEF
jgi:hypothetical protein